jgi:hypothetical protein
MKILTTLMACVTYATAFGQTETSEKQIKYIFKMSPQHLVVNMLKVGGEVVNRSGTGSFQLMLQAISNNKNENYWTNSGMPYNGFGAELMFKKYLFPLQTITTRKGRQFSQGIYFAGFLQGGLYSGDFAGTEHTWDWDDVTQTYIRSDYDYDFSTKAQNVAAGFTIGLHRVYWKVLSLDAFMGAGYQAGHQKITGNPSEYANELYNFTDPYYYGILPKFGLNLGLAL